MLLPSFSAGMYGEGVPYDSGMLSVVASHSLSIWWCSQLPKHEQVWQGNQVNYLMNHDLHSPLLPTTNLIE